MNKISTYLKSYSFSTESVNRLIVSNILLSNGIQEVQNILINSFRITEESDDWNELQNFIQFQEIKTIEDLIKTFEYVISPEDRIVTGAIYTPELIRNYILEQVLNDGRGINSIKICDPACGCASFLYSAALQIKELTGKALSEIYNNNIFGLDIQVYSVERARILLALTAILSGEDQTDFNFNLFNGNALNFDWSKYTVNFNGFDAVVGNPPYVCSRNIDPESREFLKSWSVCSTGHPDLYIPFFELGITNLKENGILGYITMNTFFKSINGRALRNFLRKFENTIVDFGGYQIFDSRSTYTCICLTRKRTSNYVSYSKIDSLDELKKKIQFKNINIADLDHFNGWNLQEVEILHKIESIGTTLGEQFKTRNGIATLKNNIYIFSPIGEDDDFFYFQNGIIYPIEKGICNDIINSNKFTKIQSIESIRQKIIFPYKYKGDRTEIIDEEELAENYPQAYKYLNDKKTILATRDKGKKQYEKWYAYGRNQSLEKMPHKLFFPHISSNIPNFVINDEEDLLFYNGLALIGENQRDLLIIQKIMGSRLFWYYITKSSKPYGSGYFSLSKNYIKNFGIYNFTQEDIDYMLSEEDKDALNNFIESKYGVEINEQIIANEE